MRSRVLLAATLCLILARSPAGAVTPSDYFAPPITMYAFTDFWLVRPLDLAALPFTTATWVCSLPITAASGTTSEAYDLLMRQPAEHLMARPVGQFWEWDNRDQNRPVVIKFKDSYAMADLSPEQERKYRAALKDHENRMKAIEREEELPQQDRDNLVQGEEKRWENFVRLLMSL
jgi:hypothetical protein